MPELPEVESLRLSLEPRLEGRSFDRIIVRERRLRQRVPESIETELPGRRIDAIARAVDLVPQWLTPLPHCCGVSNRYDQPAQLGADR